jgi:hypothetical protein
MPTHALPSTHKHSKLMQDIKFHARSSDELYWTLAWPTLILRLIWLRVTTNTAMMFAICIVWTRLSVLHRDDSCSDAFLASMS